MLEDSPHGGRSRVGEGLAQAPPAAAGGTAREVPEVPGAAQRRAHCASGWAASSVSEQGRDSWCLLVGSRAGQGESLCVLSHREPTVLLSGPPPTGGDTPPLEGLSPQPRRPLCTGASVSGLFPRVLGCQRRSVAWLHLGELPT